MPCDTGSGLIPCELLADRLAYQVACVRDLLEQLNELFLSLEGAHQNSPESVQEAQAFDLAEQLLEDITLIIRTLPESIEPEQSPKRVAENRPPESGTIITPASTTEKGGKQRIWINVDNLVKNLKLQSVRLSLLGGAEQASEQIASQKRSSTHECGIDWL